MPARTRERKRQRTVGDVTVVETVIPPEKYLLAARYGWDVVEEYLERQESGGETSWRSIADFFTATKSVKMTHTFVGTTLRRWQENGDPAHIGTGGDTSRRASTDERVWIKTLLRSQPDLYFFEVTEKFVKEFT